jgi:hypothetical protein
MLRSTILILLMLLTTPAAFAKTSGTDFIVSFLAGVPHPVNLGLDLRHGRFSEGLTGGLLSLSFKNNINVKISNVELRGRWHPFSGSFILGTAVGQQSITGSTTQTFTTNPGGIEVPTKIELAVQGGYVTPHLGWLWVWGSGFSLGFEVGVQVPFAQNSELEITIQDPSQNAFLDQVKATPEYQQAESDVTTNSDRLGKQVLPYVTVLRLGWAF